MGIKLPSYELHTRNSRSARQCRPGGLCRLGTHASKAAKKKAVELKDAKGNDVGAATVNQNGSKPAGL